MPEVKKDYEFFDHTADIGIRAEGSVLAVVCIGLARGLVELIAEDSALKPAVVKTIDLKADDAPALVLAWLQHLLDWFFEDRFLPCEYQLDEVSTVRLRGSVRGERFDPTCHVQGREVKAITRHQLRVEERAGRWYAEVIVDI